MSVNSKDLLPKVEIIRKDQYLIDIFVDGEKLTDVQYIEIGLYPQNLPVISYSKVLRDENGNIETAITDGKQAIATKSTKVSASSLKIDI